MELERSATEHRVEIGVDILSGFNDLGRQVRILEQRSKDALAGLYMEIKVLALIGGMHPVQGKRLRNGMELAAAGQANRQIPILENDQRSIETPDVVQQITFCDQRAHDARQAAEAEYVEQEICSVGVSADEERTDRIVNVNCCGVDCPHTLTCTQHPELRFELAGEPGVVRIDDRDIPPAGRSDSMVSRTCVAGVLLL